MHFPVVESKRLTYWIFNICVINFSPMLQYAVFLYFFESYDLVFIFFFFIS